MQDEQFVDEDNDIVNQDTEGADELVGFYNHIQEISKTLISCSLQMIVGAGITVSW
jgi:hypothetical protein